MHIATAGTNRFTRKHFSHPNLIELAGPKEATTVVPQIIHQINLLNIFKTIQVPHPFPHLARSDLA